MRPVEMRRARLADFLAQAAAAAPSSEGRLAIRSVRAFTVEEPVSRRTYTVVRVEDAAGISGYGETTRVNGADLERARSILRGQEATAFETLRVRLSAMPNIQAAINMALLDIAGQSTGVPVYHVLGGPTRHKARVMAVLEGESETHILDSLKQAHAAGFRAFLVPAAPAVAPNSGKAFVLANQKRLEAMRAETGEETDFVLDCGGSLAPSDAASLAAALERWHPLWIDEPCPIANLAALRKIAAESVTPLGFGRTLTHCGAFQDLVREDSIDVFRPCVALNGISQIRRYAALAEANYLAVAPFHAGGPVGTAAALHLAASLPNFFIQQIPLPASEADRKFRAELTGSSVETVNDGYAALPTAPGLGIRINTAMLRKEVV